MPKKGYTTGDIVDLDNVMISPEAFARWQAVAAVGAQALAALFPGESLEIPDEQGLLLASGELEIFVEVQVRQHKPIRISQKIPPNEWGWR